MTQADATAERYSLLLELGVSLSAERDHHRLLEMILRGAKSISNADGGTLYLVDAAQNAVVFAIMLTDSLDFAMGGSTGKPIPFPPLKLYDAEGKPNHRNVATHCALSKSTVNIADAYEVNEFDFAGTRAFDARTGYRSKSFLTVPLTSHENEVVGVLQLLNAQAPDGTVIPFDREITRLIEALAGQAAVALENATLINGQKQLFKSFVELIAGAIDAKNPATGGHCERVPSLTLMLTRAACDATDGPFADFNLTDDEWYELQIAGGMHDCGKITTPEFIIDKATKLETIYNRIHEVRMRFEVLKRDARIACLEAKLAGDRPTAELEAEMEARLAQLDADFAFVAECNIGGEFMRPERVERLNAIAAETWQRTIDDRLGLSRDEMMLRRGPAPSLPVTERLIDDQAWHIVPHPKPIDEEAYAAHGIRLKPPAVRLNRGELYNLSIGRGTLTAEDRFIINDHIIQTILMLKALPFPKNLARVPEWAGGHHEKMDGTGYPKGLKRQEMSIPARIMAIADIFEALTAADRPYKPAKPLSEAFKIMERMAVEQHIDPDLWRLFVSSGVWRDYAAEHLRPDQLDEVKLAS